MVSFEIGASQSATWRDSLLNRLRTVFQCHESKSALRKKFESRMWKKDKSFYKYVHEKIIIGNRVPVDQDKLIEQIVEGIPDIALRDQARLQRFVTTEVLLRAFKKVSLRDCDILGYDRWNGRSGGATRE